MEGEAEQGAYGKGNKCGQHGTRSFQIQMIRSGVFYQPDSVLSKQTNGP